MDARQRGIVTICRLAKDRARFFAGVRQRLRRIRTDRETAEASADAVAHYERAFAAARDAHAEASQHIVPIIALTFAL